MMSLFIAGEFMFAAVVCPGSLLTDRHIGRGVGNVLAAPISAGLRHPWALTGHSSFAYGLKGYVSFPVFP